VDAGDFVGESDEGNNSREIPLPEIPLPDLTISDLTVSPAENLSHGQRVTLRATVQNIGATTLVPFRVEFQIAGETLTQSVAGLQGGQSTVVEAVWVAKAGQHTLRVFVDTTRIIPESNEDNNVAERQLPEITAPDLSVTSIALNPQSGFVSGDTVTVAVTVQIGGTGRLIAPIPVILLDNGQRVGTRQLDAGLTAGQNVTLAFSWRVLPGAHTLRAVVDPDNILPEPNEENNATEQQVSEIPTPDFALNAVLVPENPFTG
jgi:subtilase family serine protease